MQGVGIYARTQQSRRKQGRWAVMAGAPPVEPAASGQRLRRTYSSMWAGEDLDEDYGSTTGGPPKNRRAGALIRHEHTALHCVLRFCLGAQWPCSLS